MKKIRGILLFIGVMIALDVPMLLTQIGMPTKALFIFSMSIAFVYLTVINIIPCFPGKEKFRLSVLRGGSVLMNLCAISTVLNTCFMIFWIASGSYGGVSMLSLEESNTFSPIVILVTQIVWLVLGEFVLFLNAAIRIFCCSSQITLVNRVLIILCWWIPIVNIVLFVKMSRTAKLEIELELEKTELDFVRAENEICKTKYPILMVHGVFFRDIRFFNYWGRVPKELMRNGATVYYGNQQSAATVAASGEELAGRIEELIKQTGCEKVNVIAHSKGGLDMRYAISHFGANQYVASLTTINTPHRGCAFAEYLIDKAPEGLRKGIEKKYNGALKKLGDSNPDFMGAVEDLTVRSCGKINETTKDMPGIFYQSVGSKMNRSFGGRFPLNMSYRLVKYFDGDNDGLVSMPSAVWGEKFTPITVSGKRGISHGDMIDLNRENIREFDVREFYVNLVADLKNKGL